MTLSDWKLEKLRQEIEDQTLYLKLKDNGLATRKMTPHDAAYIRARANNLAEAIGELLKRGEKVTFPGFEVFKSSLIQLSLQSEFRKTGNQTLANYGNEQFRELLARRGQKEAEKQQKASSEAARKRRWRL